MKKTAEKVLLTKAQAEALEAALDFCGKKSLVIENHLTAIWSGTRKPLADLSLETLLDALIEGFEVEPSPEEKLIEYYKTVTNDHHAAGQKAGILNTLQLLNIEITGVNC